MPEADRQRIEACLDKVRAARVALLDHWPAHFGHLDASVATYMHATSALTALDALRRSLGLDLCALLASDLAQSALRGPRP